MATERGEKRELSPRMRRMLERIYDIDGVVAARVWQWPGRVAVGIQAGSATASGDLLKRVEIAVAGLREAGEVWDFGILQDTSHGSGERL
jgi:hypothetical protein